MKKRQIGITLIEVILVIAVGAMIILFSLRQYQLFKADSDIRQLQENVDKLFNAMSNFYQYQCYGKTPPGILILLPPTIAYGRLNPHMTTATLFPITAMTDLATPGFISAASFANNPLIDSTGPATNGPFNGYVLQFNRSNESHLVCTAACNASVPVTGITSATNCCATAQTGTTVSWNPQVAVLLKNTATALAYLRLLGGDCLSTLQSGNVLPCTGTGPGSGNYVVWERPPGYASQGTKTSSMELNPTVKQFTNMYRVSPITHLTGMNHTTEFQYYVCGG